MWSNSACTTRAINDITAPTTATSYTFNVSGLTGSTTYYVTFSVRDAAGNTEALPTINKKSVTTTRPTWLLVGEGTTLTGSWNYYWMFEGGYGGTESGHPSSWWRSPPTSETKGPLTKLAGWSDLNIDTYSGSIVTIYGLQKLPQYPYMRLSFRERCDDGGEIADLDYSSTNIYTPTGTGVDVFDVPFNSRHIRDHGHHYSLLLENCTWNDLRIELY